MSLDHRDAHASAAAIGGHPLHPMLVPFPIASLVGALVTDIVYLANHAGFWADASYWLLLAGVVTGAVAGLAGLADFLSIRAAHSLAAAWMHFIGNGLVLLLALWNLVHRWDDPAAGVGGLGIVLSAVVVALLLVTGWLGGELAYRHRIGVIPRGSRAEPGAADAEPRLARRAR